MTTTGEQAERIRRSRRRVRATVAMVGLLATMTLTGCRAPIGGDCEIWWGEPAIFNPGGALYTPNGSAILGLALLIPVPVCGDQRNV